MMTNNTISNDAVTNVSGNYPGPGGYQAGVSDAGDFDQIQNNRICGVGYTPAATPPPFLYKIDISYANDVTVERNTSCGSKNTAAPEAQSVLAQHAVVHRQDKASVVR